MEPVFLAIIICLVVVSLLAGAGAGHGPRPHGPPPPPPKGYQGGPVVYPVEKPVTSDPRGKQHAVYPIRAWSKPVRPPKRRPTDPTEENYSEMPRMRGSR